MQTLPGEMEKSVTVDDAGKMEIDQVSDVDLKVPAGEFFDIIRYGERGWAVIPKEDETVRTAYYEVMELLYASIDGRAPIL